MEWQLSLTLVLVGIASAYLALRGWRTYRASKAGCAGGCGCTKAPTPGGANKGTVLIPASELTMRRKKSAL